MDQAVELPGEANPLQYSTVLDVLTSLMSGFEGSSGQRLQTGTKQLSNWEKKAHYHSLLQVALFQLPPPFVSS